MASTIRCMSPVDGRIYFERPIADAATIERALALAKDQQLEWAQLTLGERCERVSAMVDAMLAMRDEIVPELAWQMGRPIRFGGGELAGLEERARHMLAIAPQALADVVPQSLPGFKRYIRRAPLGVVLVVAPWNYPYLTAVNSVVPALIAGNAVILKHASQTLAVGDRFQLGAERAGIPPGVFQHLVLDHQSTELLLRQGHVQQVNFTGSVRGGQQMEMAAAGQFLGVGLELGGKDAAYVRSDVNLDHAVENLVDGVYFNSGQSCCGIERIYVHSDRYHEFIDHFVELANRYVLGDPLDDSTTLGPMVRSQAADFVREQVSGAVANGARALVDSQRFARDRVGSCYMAPQVVVDVDHSMSLMRDESFGPVVGIMQVRDDETALSLMNDSEFGLTASVWTRDLDAAEHLAHRLQVGTVFMNRCDYLDPALAWTGVKHTGRGVTLSQLGYETLTRPKSYHLRSVD